MAEEKKENPPEPAKPEQRTAFERVQLARHSDRPYTLDLIERLFEDFVELMVTNDLRRIRQSCAVWHAFMVCR